MSISSLRFRSSNSGLPGQGAKASTGFTLIELVVIVAIIGVLSAIIATKVSGARVNARDAQRFKDLETLQAAVEMYFRDNGHYPVVDPIVGVAPHWYASFDAPAFMGNGITGNPNTPNTLATALQQYLPVSFKDPNPRGGGGYLYHSYDAAGSNYCILFWLTPENMFNFPMKSIDMTSRCGSIGSDGQCTNRTGTGFPKNNIIYASDGTPAC